MIALRMAAFWPLWLIGLGGILAVVATGAQVGGTQRRRARRYARLSARHVLGDELPEQPHAYESRPFYGSMDLDSEAADRALRTYGMLNGSPMTVELLAAPEPSEAEVAASRAAHGYIPELDTDLDGSAGELREPPGASVQPDSGPEVEAVVPKSSPGPDLCRPGVVDQDCPVHGPPGAIPAGFISQAGCNGSGPHRRILAATGLGPRAQAVLDRYEVRHQERWGYRVWQEIGVLA